MNETSVTIVRRIAASPAISLPIPALGEDNAAWYIFLAWFLLSAGTVIGARGKSVAQQHGAS